MTLIEYSDEDWAQIAESIDAANQAVRDAKEALDTVKAVHRRAVETAHELTSRRHNMFLTDTRTSTEVARAAGVTRQCVSRPRLEAAAASAARALPSAEECT